MCGNPVTHSLWLTYLDESLMQGRPQGFYLKSTNKKNAIRALILLYARSIALFCTRFYAWWDFPQTRTKMSAS